VSAILGISAFYHDSAAAVIVDGRIVAAAQEERFSRTRHDAAYPRRAVDWALEAAGLSLAEVERVAFYDKPFLKFERLVETYVAMAPRGFRSFATAIPVWLREKLFQKRLLLEELERHPGGLGGREKLLFAEHHLSHAASAFYPSPFEEAVVLTMDGVGEWATTTVSIGRGNRLTVEKEIAFPHSLGLLYSAFTYYLGFKVNSGEYKVMGLAPYGEPRFAEAILSHLIDLKADGSFRLDQRYFAYCTGLTMTSRAFDRLFGQPPRREGEPLTQFHMDLAASLQAVTEEAVLRLTRALARDYAIPNLCLAGGVALNCVANGKVARDGAFERLWVQPAAGDAGGAPGAALAAWHMELGKPRVAVSGDAMSGAYLGPEYPQEEIERRLAAAGARFDVLDETGMIEAVAGALAEGAAVGWFQGRMEFGPRALGARSILADPRSETMQRTLNLKVKYRESFRPFAPAVLREKAGDWFELDGESPYMLLTAAVRPEHRRALSEADRALFGIDRLNVPRSAIPAVTHVDWSARVQTVDEATNPRFHALLSAFERRSGVPVLVNTSFNVRGEPIVCSPEDAFRCFMGTELDLLAVGNCLLRKADQDPALRHDHASAYGLD
jgi:carbamoyltransferase